jgi:preprotein translocase subunit YajC
MINQVILMAGSSGKEGSSIMSFIPIIIIFVIFYFFMIRPQIKKQKDQKKYMEELKKGDKIITIGGIHGKIAEINDTTFMIEVEGGVRLKIQKSAVSMDATSQLNAPAK